MEEISSWLGIGEYSLYLNIFIKLFLGLVALIFLINISGKGNHLTPATALDQIHTYILGGIVGNTVYDTSISIVQFLIVLTIWMLMVLILKRLKAKNHSLKSWVDGEPLIIINRGKLDVETCRRVGLTAHDVAFKLRREGVYRIKDVKRAVLEQNGEFIIVLSGEENPKYPIITDGTIQVGILETVNQTEEWLMERLAELGYESVSEVFIAEYEDGKIFVIPYQAKEKKETKI